MPRPLLIRSNAHPYHIMSRTYDRSFFPLPLERVWEIMLANLKQCHDEYSLAIHAFVLMGNHFHLLCHTPKSNIDECMHSLLRNISIAIRKEVTNLEQVWEGRYRWSLIDSQRHYYQVYRYIFQNPVRAGITKRVEEYQFTTLRQEKIPFPIHSFVPMSFGGQEGEIIWLNEKYDKEDADLIRMGLRHSQFNIDKRKIKTFNKLSLPSDS